MTDVDIRKVQVIAPNFKRRISGVTSTVIRLVPVQARDINIVATGPVLPDDIPRIPLHRLITMPRSGPDGRRVWHARRNVEMIGGLVLKHLFRKRLALMFTSASQRKQTSVTRWLIRQMDKVIATSENSAAYLEVPSQVIMHGIDTEDYTPVADRAALRRELGLPQGLLMGCYGRIRAQKGTDVFVDAMLRVLPDHPDAHAVVMGRATSQYETYLKELKARVDAAGMAGQIHFRDEVTGKALAPHFQALDLYVAPQRWEGFGLTPIEAMACDVPVIATRVGAFEQLVLEGETGTLVDPDDVDQMAAAIRRALETPDLIKNWSANCRPHILKDYSINREAADLIAVYRALLSQG